MKPSWDDAPEWATHLAMDDDGEWNWHPRKPVYQMCCDGERVYYKWVHEPMDVAQYSLESRP